ncbi:MAG: tetratricopeptide repeat protein [Brevibacillus sp.]|nr:tetratricopeptide repeat protein [Brevibacillus sp.]
MSDYVEYTNEHGEKVRLSREEYQKKVIPHKLHLYWDDKEALRQYAMQLVQDKFTGEAAQAADRLLELFGPIEGALIFRAVVHMQAREFDQAKELLTQCIERFPSSGYAYTNLAKIYAYEGSNEKAFETLETGLMKDPNQETGLDWYISLFQQNNRQEELMRRLKALTEREGAWRPSLLLGRLYLQDGNLLKAMQFYRQAIEKSGQMEDVVMTVTGELGQAQYVYQLIQIAEAYWKPTFETPYAGYNYANALIVTEQKERAIEVLQAMLQHVREEYRPGVAQYLEKLGGQSKRQEENKQEQTVQQPAEKKRWWKIWK